MPDTGPALPRFAYGDNAIGKFTIGVSQIGDYPLLDFWNTIISQYANSPILTQLIANMFQYIDQTANVIAFFDNIMNIDTAAGPGLDLWGRILGVGRVLTIPATSFFGFEEQGVAGVAGFNQAPFFSGTLSNNNFALSDDSYRVLLLAKALANITSGTIPALNQILLNLFPGRGNAFVTDLGNMQMTYTFNFVLSPVEQAIVTASGVLPKPVGVSLTIVQTAGH
jgi:Protein of unknown function (DUF2612)